MQRLNDRTSVATTNASTQLETLHKHFDVEQCVPLSNLAMWIQEDKAKMGFWHKLKCVRYTVTQLHSDPRLCSGHCKWHCNMHV